MGSLHLECSLSSAIDSKAVKHSSLVVLGSPFEEEFVGFAVHPLIDHHFDPLLKGLLEPANGQHHSLVVKLLALLSLGLDVQVYGCEDLSLHH